MRTWERCYSWHLLTPRNRFPPCNLFDRVSCQQILVRELVLRNVAKASAAFASGMLGQLAHHGQKWQDLRPHHARWSRCQELKQLKIWNCIITVANCVDSVHLWPHPNQTCPPPEVIPHISQLLVPMATAPDTAAPNASKTLGIQLAMSQAWPTSYPKIPA